MYFPRLFALVFLVFVHSCREKPAETKADNRKCITDTLAARMTFDTVKTERIHKTLALTGTVTANEDQMVKVNPVVSGNVEQMNVQRSQR